MMNAGTTYDPAGNLPRLTLGGETFEYEYDGLSMMRSLVSTTDQAKVFLYPCLYPFGQEATDPTQDPVRLKCTGHERDKNGSGKGMLDYLHARYESPMVGR